MSLVPHLRDLLHLPCPHSEWEWVRNESVPCTATVNGVPDQSIVISGYVERCTGCLKERFWPVG